MSALTNSVGPNEMWHLSSISSGDSLSIKVSLYEFQFKDKQLMVHYYT